MTTIVTRAGKGSPLTHTEVDTNFTNLNTNKLEAGAIALGSAATPSISFTGDTNTGIYSPGADQVAISTGGSGRLRVSSTGTVEIVGAGTIGSTQAVSFNGSAPVNSMALDSSGRLGIGTSAPAYQFQVNATSDVVMSTSNSTSVTSGNRGTIAHLNSANSTCAMIRFAAVTDNVGTEMQFHTRPAAGSLTQSMTLDSAGRLGIGTTSPQVDFQIGNADGSSRSIVIHTANNGDARLRFREGATVTSGFNEYSFGMAGSANAMTWESHGLGEIGRWDSAGRLLVGTIASPAHQLQVSTDSAGKPSTNTWTIVSDERIKEEIELADLDLCYEAVKSIPLKRFKWKDEVYTEEQVRDRRKLGWIAQDVEAVFPKAVGTYEFKYNQVFEETIIPAIEEVLDNEGNVTTPAQPERIEKGELISEDVIEDCRDLNSDQLYAAMYGAIQKLMAKVETLEIEVASLKAS